MNLPMTVTIDAEQLRAHNRSASHRWLSVAGISLPVMVAVQLRAREPGLGLFELFELVVLFGTSLVGFFGGLARWRRLRRTPAATAVLELCESTVRLSRGAEPGDERELVAVHLLPGWARFVVLEREVVRSFDLPLDHHQAARVAQRAGALVSTHRSATFFLLAQIARSVRTELAVQLITWLTVVALAGAVVWALARTALFFLKR